jgi:hypothetical protein
MSSNCRSTLDDSNDRRIRPVTIGQRRKHLLAAQSIDHALLPPAENGVRKNRKMAEHPQKIQPLEEGKH